MQCLSPDRAFGQPRTPLDIVPSKVSLALFEYRRCLDERGRLRSRPSRCRHCFLFFMHGKPRRPHNSSPTSHGLPPSESDPCSKQLNISPRVGNLIYLFWCQQNLHLLLLFLFLLLLLLRSHLSCFPSLLPPPLPSSPFVFFSSARSALKRTH